MPRLLIIHANQISQTPPPKLYLRIMNHHNALTKITQIMSKIIITRLRFIQHGIDREKVIIINNNVRIQNSEGIGIDTKRDSNI